MNSFCGDLKPLCNIQPIKRDQKNLRTDEAKMNLCQDDGKKKVKEQLIYHVWQMIKQCRDEPERARWWKWQEEFWGVKGCTFCLDSAKYCKNVRTVQINILRKQPKILIFSLTEDKSEDPDKISQGSLQTVIDCKLFFFSKY